MNYTCSKTWEMKNRIDFTGKLGHQNLFDISYIYYLEITDTFKIRSSKFELRWDFAVAKFSENGH